MKPTEATSSGAKARGRAANDIEEVIRLRNWTATFDRRRIGTEQRPFDSEEARLTYEWWSIHKNTP